MENSKKVEHKDAGIGFQTKKFRLRGVTEILGSLPASNAIFTQFIASKAPKEELMEEEADFVSLEEKGTTVFARNPQTKELMLLDYQVKGLLKEGINVLKADNEIGAGRKKTDNYVFVFPRYIPIKRNGVSLLDEDEMYERPLRCQTMQGERVSLASSEMIRDPWEITIEIMLLNNKGTKASAPLTWNAIKQALNYGHFKGLGQFRNGGFGRFEWEEIKD